MRCVVVLVALAGCGRIDFGAALDAPNGPIDAGVPDVAATAACNQITRFADDFEDGVLDVRHWVASFIPVGASVGETAGDLVLVPAPNLAAAYLTYDTHYYYDLRGTQMSAELSLVANAGTTTGISIIFDLDNYVQITVKDNILAVSGAVNGAFAELTSGLHDPVADRFLAIGEATGTMTFSSSPDGVTWSPIFATPAPFDVSLVYAELFVGTDAAVASPGEAHFASYNGGSATGSACKASSLVDHFDGSVPDHVWVASHADSCCAQTSVATGLQIDTDGQPGRAEHGSSAAFDLTSDAIVMQTPTMASDIYMAAVARAQVDSQTLLEVQSYNGMYSLRIAAAGNQNFQQGGHPAANTFTRLRETAGTIFMEDSLDGVTWNVITQLPTPFPIDEVEIFVGGGTAQGSPADSLVIRGINGF